MTEEEIVQLRCETDDSMQFPISEGWLKEVGFKWHQFDRQPEKQWLLWIGNINSGRLFGSFEDIGIELAPVTREENWFCWLRSDCAHKYSRFIHVRYLRTRGDLIKLFEGLTGQTWNPANNLYGSARTPEQAARIREEDERRLDRRLMRLGHPWAEIEKDASRGGALPEHMEAARKAGGCG